MSPSRKEAVLTISMLLAIPTASHTITAQAQDLPAGCDAILDPNTVTRHRPPLEISVAGNLCLDSHQVMTWFLSHGGWSSDLADNPRYWRLSPPAFPARTALFLIMPGGERRKVLLMSRQTSA